jgi:hypothetical protein
VLIRWRSSLLAGVLCAVWPASAEPVEFNKDIRPILSDKCFFCHGPDQANRMSKLRLDQEESAFGDLGNGRRGIVPGDPAASQVYLRIAHENAALRMPPAHSGHKLTDGEIRLIRRWIEEGAKWEGHWSFIPPKRRELPEVKQAGWARNPIDRFVLARLEREGLKPSPEADRTDLIRRLSFDMTGLPPTPAEIDAFLADQSPDAYEKLVDRLLNSPRYGERMATPWLNAARYADTNGYQTDAERDMWRWREWVIEAFNRNMPFDRFTVDQLAGDMLPNARLDQVIASGFNRNHRGNGEGGIIAEEYAVEYVVDRVDTTATVWLGLTMGCARCHDHKYDPITQKEFYRVFAYFNNIPERGRAFKYGNSPPFIHAPTPEQQRDLAQLEQRLWGAEEQFRRQRSALDTARRQWEKKARTLSDLDWSLPEDLVAHYPLDGDLSGNVRPVKESPIYSQDEQAKDPAKDGAKNEPPTAKAENGQASFAAGRLRQASAFDGSVFIDAGDVANFGFYDKFTLGAWINPAAPDGAILSRADDKELEEGQGYGIYLKDGKLQLNLVQRWLDDSLRVETAEPLALHTWHHVLVTYDGSRLAEGVQMYVNGKPAAMHVALDELNQDFKSRQPLRIGAGGGGPGFRFHGLIDDVRVYDQPLSAQLAAVIANPDSIGAIAALPETRRDAAQALKLERYFLAHAAPEPIAEAWRNLWNLRRERQLLIESFPTVMVMKEMETPRETFLLKRGAYDAPGDKVSPGVPEALPPLPEGYPNNRLGFARWLVDPSNPLTARVAANRLWQLLFGAGLVKTVEDFGSQGEWPSHPDLLDWLAVEFMDSGWDVKALLKTMVTSATYRQTSKASPELIQRDPENRLLARGPRFRLAPEMVRDQALAISGLLVEKIGGPSVKPYQPPGLWKELAGGRDYQPDTGEKLYRRSLYTFWKRAVPPPSMMTFDAAGREACVVRENRTNTPLQALALMNEVTYVEAARMLAARMMREGDAAPETRIDFAFRLATSRRPKAAEREILVDSFHYHLDSYKSRPEAAVKLLSEGESPRPEDLDAGELAAYTAVASLILNLDETVTKE